MHEDLFIDALGDNPSALSLRAEKLIVSLAAGKAVVPCKNLAVEQFSRMNLCELRPENTPRLGSYRYWGGEEFDQLYTSYDQVTWSVKWNDHRLSIVHLEWETGCGGDNRDWVIAESIEIAEDFVLDVSRKTHAPGNAILVFSGGRWNRSEALYNATQSASFEDLVLADDLKATTPTALIRRSSTDRAVSIASTTLTCRISTSGMSTSRTGKNNSPAKPIGQATRWSRSRSSAKDSRLPT